MPPEWGKKEEAIYQPKTGEVCGCKKGIERDNCPACEGTGMRIDFEAIRARVTEEKKYSAIADPCTTERCVNPAMTWRGDVRYCTECAARYDIRFGDR